MPRWSVHGTFLARRSTWQSFTKVCEAPNAAQAKEWALSEIGGCHGVRRSLIRVESVAEDTA
ncbi:MAG TPA: 50S ribosomal protein L18Ae [Thermoplasmata archaeon]|nr:50S ribosomal protein L18Ae [Thermoplasmata archaeon]